MYIDNIDPIALKQERKKVENDINQMLDALENRQVAKTQDGPDKIIGTAVSSVILILDEIGLLIPIIRKIVSVLFFIPKRWRQTILKFLDAVEVILPSEEDKAPDAVPIKNTTIG